MWFYRATGVLDDMPIFFDQTADNMQEIPGEDTASQSVLVQNIFRSKKLVNLLIL